MSEKVSEERILPTSPLDVLKSTSQRIAQIEKEADEALHLKKIQLDIEN